MQIVGTDTAVFEPDHVHTIDVWYSPRRDVWIVERLSAEGHLVGHAACFESEDDARDCVAGWLRAHAETAYVTPRSDPQRTASAMRAPRRTTRHAA